MLISNHIMKPMRTILLSLLCLSTLLPSLSLSAANLKATLKLKTPGNVAASYNLRTEGNRLFADKALPLDITLQQSVNGDDDIVTVNITARQNTYFNLAFAMPTGLKNGHSEFFLPGLWYHRNLRSPKQAPNYGVSKSWTFREDRMSTPLASAFDAQTGKGISVLRVVDKAGCDAQVQNTEGEIILPSPTSVGYVGFDDSGNETQLTFGFPYTESPKRYIRKLTLAPAVEAFMPMSAGETKTLVWRIHRLEAKSYGDFVTKVWQYSFDQMAPEPLPTVLDPAAVKANLCGYFRNSYVGSHPLKYNSGITILTADCKPSSEVQIGFCGRVLLNAFNEIEYGDAHHDTIAAMGHAILDSWLRHGFSPKGYFHDFINYGSNPAKIDDIHSIRQQSEAVYAILHYLNYEKQYGKKDKATKQQIKEWETKIRHLLDNLVALQKEDGHFARKFRDDGSDVDNTGGSTPSATSTLVMGWKYFGDKRYLQAAKRTMDYVEKNIISKSDYFSSTLDANCEDKEAAIAAVTASYYLAMVTKGQERQHYISLCQQAAYFAMTWYYTWDVPFAAGQMLGDVHFHSRGWGNVSVENNHIDVFVFELPHIIQWLAGQTGETRFQKMHDVITSSLTQLMPTEAHHFGIAVPGFYPEVVQHTTWDYGRNGKGFYNNLFAPGWTVASLWEMCSPERTVNFLRK